MQVYPYEANDVPKACHDDLARKLAQQTHVEENKIFDVNGPLPLRPMRLPNF